MLRPISVTTQSNALTNNSMNTLKFKRKLEENKNVKIWHVPPPPGKIPARTPWSMASINKRVSDSLVRFVKRPLMMKVTNSSHGMTIVPPPVPENNEFNG